MYGEFILTCTKIQLIHFSAFKNRSCEIEAEDSEINPRYKHFGAHVAFPRSIKPVHVYFYDPGSSLNPEEHALRPS